MAESFFPLAAAYQQLADAARETAPESYIEAASVLNDIPSQLSRGLAYLQWVLAHSEGQNFSSPDEHKNVRSVLAELSGLCAELIDHQSGAGVLPTIHGVQS